MTVISRVLGFVRDVLIAAVLGASSITDAFFVAFRVPNMFRRLFAEGAFNAAFIPLFTKTLHAEGEEAARDFAAKALSGLTVVLVTYLRSSPRSPCPGLSCCWRRALPRIPTSTISPCSWRASRCPISCSCPGWRSTRACSMRSAASLVAAFAPSLLNVVLIAVLLGIVATGTAFADPQPGSRLLGASPFQALLQVAVVGLAAAKAGHSPQARTPSMDARHEAARAPCSARADRRRAWLR